MIIVVLITLLCVGVGWLVYKGATKDNKTNPVQAFATRLLTLL